jgi:hypothetical protein
LKWIVKGKEGVAVSSDSKVTVGPASYEVRKAYPILLTVNGEDVPLAVAGGAGAAPSLSRALGYVKGFLRIWP